MRKVIRTIEFFLPDEVTAENTTRAISNIIDGHGAVINTSQVTVPCRQTDDGSKRFL